MGGDGVDHVARVRPDEDVSAVADGFCPLGLMARREAGDSTKDRLFFWTPPESVMMTRACFSSATTISTYDTGSMTRTVDGSDRPSRVIMAAVRGCRGSTTDAARSPVTTPRLSQIAGRADDGDDLHRATTSRRAATMRSCWASVRSALMGKLITCSPAVTLCGQHSGQQKAA